MWLRSRVRGSSGSDHRPSVGTATDDPTSARLGSFLIFTDPFSGEQRARPKT